MKASMADDNLNKLKWLIVLIVWCSTFSTVMEFVFDTVKTLCEKEKMLDKSISSFSNNVL